MIKSEQNVKEFLNQKQVANQCDMEYFGTMGLSLENMFSEFMELGYEWKCLEDIDFEDVKSKKIIDVFLKYYDKLDLYYRDKLMYKLNPPKYPNMIHIVVQEFANFGFEEKQHFCGYEVFLSKLTKDELYLPTLLEMMSNGENFVTLFEVGKKIAQNYPELFLPIIDKFSNTVFLVRALQYMRYLPYSQDLLKRFEMLDQISEKDLILYISNTDYPVSEKCFNYWKNLLTISRIREETRPTIRKIKNLLLKN